MKVSENKGIILFNVVLMSFISCVDMSIVNIALPIMAKKLCVSMAAIEWVVVSYIMIICSIILIFGRLGDIKGKTRVFQAGILIFTIASFMCGMTNSLVSLVIFRIIQGIGAAACMANNQGIITQVFPKEGRGKALGILASAVALGSVAGPALGGIILATLNWNCIFFVNVPIGIFAFLLGLKVLPKGKQNNEKIDIKGAVLFFITIICLFIALIGQQTLGITNPLIIVSFIVAIISFAVFVKAEKEAELPMLQLDIFKNSLFSISLVCAFASFVCISASNIIIPFYLIDAHNISSSASGMIMIISPIIIAIITPLTGSLSDKIGAEILTVIGLVNVGIAFFLMSFLKVNTSVGFMIAFLIIMSVGNALFQPSNNSLIMSAAPKDKLGIAGSVNSLVRNIGQYIGITLSTTVLYLFMSRKAGHAVTDYIGNRPDIFMYGMKYVYIILAGICLLGALITVYRLVVYKVDKKTEELDN